MRAPRPRWIVANLDCESEFAHTAGGRGVPLSAAARAAIASAGTLLRAFAREGDRLWLPAPVDAERVAAVPGLPMPAFESGPLANAEGIDEVLAWGETTAIARHRRPRSAGGAPPRRGSPLHRLLWHLPPASPEAAAAVNDRRFALAVARELGCALPGARTVASRRQLEAHLAAGGADAATRGFWVLKAPFSAAGRGRYIHRGRASETARRQIERLLARHGELLFEPWMERTGDFGCTAVMRPEGSPELSCHRLEVDRDGRFSGIELGAGDRVPTDAGLADEEHAAFARVVTGVSAALARAGYSGPFGVDAWRYRGADGREAFQPLGEINGRMTFGLVARALVDRLRRPLGLDPRDRVRLAFGRSADARATGRVSLVRAREPGDRAIWLEIQPRGNRGRAPI